MSRRDAPDAPKRAPIYPLQWAGSALAADVRSLFVVGRLVRHPHTRHVLLIDDSHDDLFLTKRVLGRAGVSVPIISIDSGEQALGYLRAAGRGEAEDLRPAIVFCDLQMPAVNGLEILQTVRGLSSLNQLPFYILTGGDIDKERARAEELGASGFLRKFPSPEEFRRLFAAVGLV